MAPEQSSTQPSPEPQSHSGNLLDPSDGRSIGTWLVTLAYKASWAFSGAGVLGAVGFETSTRLHCTQVGTWLATLGLVSLGACIGRLVDERCRKDP
jgi:hypothetical protein